MLQALRRTESQTYLMKNLRGKYRRFLVKLASSWREKGAAGSKKASTSKKRNSSSAADPSAPKLANPEGMKRNPEKENKKTGTELPGMIRNEETDSEYEEEPGANQTGSRYRKDHETFPLYKAEHVAIAKWEARCGFNLSLELVWHSQTDGGRSKSQNNFFLQYSPLSQHHKFHDSTAQHFQSFVRAQQSLSFTQSSFPILPARRCANSTCG